MTKSQLEKLIDRYLQGNASKQEADMVERFYARMVDQRGGLEEWHNVEEYEIKRRMYRKIHKHIYKNQKRLVRNFVSLAAAVLVLLVSGYLFMDDFSWETTATPPSVSFLSVAAGLQQRSVLLEDGTYVLLSPGATIQYPATFSQSTRRVELSGEAWFDVQRDTTHPFQVVTNDLITTVLGTSFRINAPSENSRVEVKVTSGRVQVNTKEGELAILAKNDQLEYEAGEYTVIREAQSDNADEEKLPEPGNWKLANVTMEEAAAFLEIRWDREIGFENPAIRQCPLYASFNADDTMEEVLMILCGVSQSKYKHEEGKIIIYGPGCQN